MSDLKDRLEAALGSRYEVIQEAGVGGMARVYRARDLRHDRPVAIKVLEPEVAEIVGANRFLQEIRVTANLQHPHILPLFDSGEAGGLLYYVMPFVDGESLRDRLAREGRLPVSDARRIFREVVDALAAAHSHAVIHRDIKPGNVLLAGRHALVADFGVARAVHEASEDERMTRVGVAVGTPRYMAPEQATADANMDHRADLFAAGVIAYEMLAGASPFAAENSQASLVALMTRAPRPLSEVNAEVPRALCDIIHRCLEKDPNDRWQSAAELLKALESLETPTVGTPAVGTPAADSRSRVWSYATLALAAVAVGVFLMIGFGEDRAVWAANEGIPEVERLLDEGDWNAAFGVINEVAAAVPDHPALEELRSAVTARRTIRSTPEGAVVHRREYGVPDAEWERLGTTPLEDILVPLGGSVFRFELPGHEPVEAVSTGRGDFEALLDPVGSLPDGMVRVPGFTLPSEFESVQVGDFFLGRHEVTNAEFKEFVDAGGYRTREYWEHPFLDGEVEVSWEEAVARFSDRTGRPGPSSWEIGTYPEGMEGHPVGGLSWYEAAAYARFRGAALPTVHHWRRAFPLSHVAYLVPHSNLESSGPTPVDDPEGLGRFGTYDMAGNVREWCLNESDGRRFIMGGGWNDPDWVPRGPYAQLAWDRAETNGVRLALYPESIPEAARRPVPPEPVPDFDSFEPVSDEVFEVYKRMFAYDPTPLDAEVTAVDTSRHWTRERVTFDAAYGGDRMVAYLYLPREGEPPFHTVLYYPGSSALTTRQIDDVSPLLFDYLLRSGRAVVLPALRGTLDRPSNIAEESRELGLDFASTPRPTNSYRDHVVQWGKDIGRTIDYLETRPEVDAEKVAFLGVSWGGRMGSIMLAVEPRFQAAVLNIAGFNASVPAPEVHAVTYAPRVRLPVLMLNGRFDNVFPLETHATPMFEALGTPSDRKKHVVSDGGHFVPRTELIRETLAWLDLHLGPVR